MRIGMLLVPLTGGLGTYCKNLISNLSLIDKENEYYLYDFSLRGNFVAIESLSENYKRKLYRFPRLSWGTQIGKVFYSDLILPYLIKKHAIQLFHCLTEYPILVKGVKSVLTIHDMHTYLFSTSPHSIYNLELKKRIGYVDKIIAVSFNTKKDIMQILNVQEYKIKVIYEGVNKAFRVIENKTLLQKTLDKYHIKNKFVLYLGGMKKLKNVDRLIKVFKRLQHLNCAEYDLIIIGEKGDEYPQLLYLTKELGLEKKINFVGFLSLEEIVAFYNCADLFVFPQIYAGFGLPIVEAFACGCPVVTANTSSLKEVGGDAVAFFDPSDEDNMTEVVYKVLTDENLKMALKNKGLQRAKLFSWENTAKETQKVYEELIND